MTDNQLHDLIFNLPAAKAQADAGNDSGCAATMIASGLLPVAIVSTILTEGGVLSVLGPTLGDASLAAIEGVANAAPPTVYSSLLGRIIRLLRVGAPSGVDFGDPAVLAMLDQLQAVGILPATAVRLLKASSQRPAIISAEDVSRVWARHRPEGRIGGVS